MAETAVLPDAEVRHLAPGLTEEALLCGRVFVRGEGAWIYDTKGRACLDLGAGILTQALGHCHPRVTASVQAQVARLTNIHDSPTPERAHLCNLLGETFPPYLSRFAFFSTGAEAVEAAIRAIHAFAPPGRTTISALRNGFHGKTQGARALVKWAIGAEPVGQNARQFHHGHCFACPLGLAHPGCEIACAHQIAEEIERSDDIAALLFEPIQAAGGVIVPPRDYWQIIAAACRKRQVLLVADEIVTAGGRIGPFLACEHYGIEPDLVLAAKGLSSGLPFSLLAGREDIMCSPRFARAGSASSTYGGNPVSCVAASATLEALRDEGVLAGVPRLGQQLGEGLADLQRHFPKQIRHVRGIGLLHAIEFGSADGDRSAWPEYAAQFYRACLDRGVRVGLGGHIARLAPPLNITEEQIASALDVFQAVLADRQPG